MIAVEHLTKRYGGQPVVSDVSFRCPPGTVTGYLGANGAGKSTTLRMLCGLVTPTTGRATVRGLPYRSLPGPGREVGVLLDATAQHGGRTGRECLTLAALVLGVDRRRVAELLETVGLPPAAARQRVGTYSLGMRQRLGLAQALLGDPAALILDEPANGLDPQGISWLRTLLRGFADRGGTVLLSSHQLLEVRAVADRLVILAGGRVAAEGEVGELLAPTGTLVRALDPAGMERALAAAGIATTRRPDGALRAQASAEAVGRVAAAERLVLVELGPDVGGGDLERLFLDLTEHRPAAPKP